MAFKQIDENVWIDTSNVAYMWVKNDKTRIRFKKASFGLGDTTAGVFIVNTPVHVVARIVSTLYTWKMYQQELAARAAEPQDAPL